MDRKEFYIEKSLKLFLKYGVKSVTIGDIANQLNISTKTIYKLFEDKTGLVKDCLTLDSEIIAQTYERILKKENALEALIEFYNELVNRISSVNPNYFDDIRKYFPQIWESSTRFSIQQIQILLQRGVNSGIFYKNIDTEICAKSLVLLIRAMLEEESFSSIITDRRKLTANVIYPYIRGICTSQGLEVIKSHFNQGVIAY
jgi:AcrR family transcriptional regulator